MTQETYYIQKCPICGRSLRIKTKYIGKKLMCRHCQGAFTAQDSSSVLDDDVRVDNVLQNLECELEKSGIFSHSSTRGVH